MNHTPSIQDMIVKIDDPSMLMFIDCDTTISTINQHQHCRIINLDDHILYAWSVISFNSIMIVTFIYIYYCCRYVVDYTLSCCYHHLSFRSHRYNIDYSSTVTIGLIREMAIEIRKGAIISISTTAVLLHECHECYQYSLSSIPSRDGISD